MTLTAESLETLLENRPTGFPLSVVALLRAIQKTIAPDSEFSTASHDSLAMLMKVSTKTAQRAHTKAVDMRVVLCESVFMCGNEIRVVSDNLSTLIDRDPARERFGRFLGYRNKINEPLLREICGLGVDKLSTLTRERWGGQVGANLGGQTVHTEGEERKGLNASTGDSNADPSEPLAPHQGDFVGLVTRMNYLFREIQARRGELPLDPVRGWKANGILRNALVKMKTILPPISIWQTWERMANLFSIWAEHHPMKKLYFVSSVFAKPDEYEIYLRELYEWEAANPTVQWRDLAPDSKSAEEVDDDRKNDPRVQEMSVAIFDTTGVSGYFPSVKNLENISAFADPREIKIGLMMIGDTGALGTRKTKVRDFFEHAGAVSVISSIRAEEEREEKRRTEEEATRKKAADDKAVAEKKRKEEQARRLALQQAGINFMSVARAHVQDDDLGIGWLASNILNVTKEWDVPDYFIADLKRLRKVEEGRRELESLKNSGALDPAIRYLEEEIRDGSEPVMSMVIPYGVKKGLSEDHIRKAAQVMGLKAQIIADRWGSEPCWGPLPKDYKSPIANAV